MESKQPVIKTKIFIETGNPVILAPLGTMTKTGKQASHRNTRMETGHGVHVHKEMFLNHKEVGRNSKSSLRKERRDDHSQLSKGDRDRQYHMILLLGVT